MKRISTAVLALFLFFSSVGTNTLVKANAISKDNFVTETSKQTGYNLPEIIEAENSLQLAAEIKRLSQLAQAGNTQQSLNPHNVLHTCRVIVCGKPDYTGFNPVGIVKDPSGIIFVQFKTEEEAFEFLKVQKWNPDVEWACYDEPVIIEDPQTSNYSPYANGYNWGVDYIETALLADRVAEGEDREIVVAVVDTGCDIDHPLLEDRLIDGWDFAEDDDDPDDDVKGHGTHVAGIIVSSTKTTEGDDLNVKIMPVRVFDDSGYASVFMISDGINYAAEHGADVINLSLGGNLDIGALRYLNGAVANAIRSGCIVCISSGNDYDDVSAYCPANMVIQGAIVVGALSDNKGNIADYSNFGDTVDVAAPGSDINSSYIDGDYITWSGTSMAAPFVSAAAAMIKSLYPKITAGGVEQLLKESAIDLGAPGFDVNYGYGAIKAFNILGLADQLSVPTITSQPDSHTSDQGKAVRFNVQASGEALDYQWKYRKNASSEWVNVYKGEKNSELTSITVNGNELALIAVSGLDGYQFMCTVSNAAGSVNSAVADLHVTDQEATGILDSGTCGYGMTWYVENGRLHVEGVGEIDDYKLGEAPWYVWNDDVRVIELPDVTGIGNYAFADFDKVTVVAESYMVGCIITPGFTAPTFLSRIGRGAFYRCELLPCADMWFNNDLEIAPDAFLYCPWIDEVKMPQGVDEIGYHTFYYNTGLHSINIPESVRKIGKSAFYYCYNLKDVYFEGTYDEWKNITIETNNSALTNASIHYQYGNLEFYVSTDPDTRKKTLYITGNGSMPEEASSRDYPWYANRAKVEKIVIGDGVTSIGYAAFSPFTKLTSISLPKNVSIGEYAFENANKLEDIYFGGNAEEWSNIEITAGNANLLNEGIRVHYKVKTGYDVYWQMQDNMLYIEGSGNMPEFETAEQYPWNSLLVDFDEITIESGITSIGKNAFSNFVSLEKINLPGTVKKVGDKAFDNCGSLKKIYVDFDHYNELTYFINSIGEDNIAFTDATIYYACGDNIHWALKNYETLLIEGDGSMPDYAAEGKEYPWADFYDCVLTLNISSGVSSVAQAAFENFEVLHDVYVPSTLHSVAENAFHNCSSLTYKRYEGTETEWNNSVSIAAGNQDLIDAHFGMNGYPTPYINDHRFLEVIGNDTVTLRYWPAGTSGTFKWYYMKPGDTEWSEVTGTVSTNRNYSFRASATHDGRAYKCVREYYKYDYSSGSQSPRLYTEESVKYVVSVSYDVPVINNPTSPIYYLIIGKNGSNTTCRINATGGGLKYQWEYRPSATAEWQIIDGATESTYTVTYNSSVPKTAQYRCRVYNLLGSVYSKTWKIIVFKPLEKKKKVDGIIKPIDGVIIPIDFPVKPIPHPPIDPPFKYKQIKSSDF